MNNDKSYSEKMVVLSFFIGIVLCLALCVYYFSGRTADTESRDVTRTIRQLERDGERATEAVTDAKDGISEAQDTTYRISRSIDESSSILDRLQAELDRIAEANGLNASQ
ncbi:hypothetical protein I3700191H1_14120 [Megasphaera massiliensis]|uniref:hypothetical protein n=1 Tax=Megasphaera massiliensis TaxID=1232428 RepID=UPI0034BE02C5